MSDTASHKGLRIMELSAIKGIGPAKQAKLNAAGIDTVHDLARCDVAKLAEQTGLSVDTVRELQGRAAAHAIVQDLKGVGPASLETFAEEGVRSLRAIAEASQQRLAEELRIARAKAAEMQAEAKQALQELAEEAKTPEGRRQIVVRTRDHVEERARRAREAALQLQQKAKEFQQQAPAQLREVREKAEKIIQDAQVRLQDAQVRLKELGEQAQATTKAELEKVKSANQRVVAQVKGRVSRKNGAGA